MNEAGTGIETNLGIATWKMRKRNMYLQRANDVNGELYARIHTKRLSYKAAFKRFQRLDTQKWADSSRGDCERALRFFVMNMMTLRPERYTEEFWRAQLDIALNEAEPLVAEANRLRNEAEAAAAENGDDKAVAALKQKTIITELHDTKHENVFYGEEDSGSDPGSEKKE
jgi:hypothetical protein